MKRLLVLVLLLSCTVAFSQNAYGQTKKQGGTSSAHSTNPADILVGNYKLDTAQSKISGQPPKEETVAVSAASKDSIKYTIQGKDAQGNSYTMNFEGKVGTAAPQMAEGKKIADITYQMPSSHQFTSQGHGTDGSSSTGTITLSQDSKTITVREHSKDPKGARQDHTIVYVKQ